MENDKVYRHIGNRIRLRRALIGLSQKALAKKLGKKLEQVKRHEEGMRDITMPQLEKFANALGVHVDYFFKGLHEPDPLEVALQGLSDAPQAVFEDNFFIEPENFEILGNYHKIADQALKGDIRQLLKTAASL